MSQFPIFGQFSEEERKAIFEKIKNLGVLNSPLSIYNTANDILEPDSRTLALDTMIILNAVQLSFIFEFMNDQYNLKPEAVRGRLSEVETLSRIILNLSQSLELIDRIQIIPKDDFEPALQNEQEL